MAVKITNKQKTSNSVISKEKLLKEIEKKAYDLFLKRKGEHGSDLNDWLEAEKTVKKQFQI